MSEFDYNKVVADFLDAQVDRFLELGRGFIKGTHNKIVETLRLQYKPYLLRVAEKYSRAKTFYIRDEPTDLYTFYVPLSIQSKRRELLKTNICDVEEVTNYAIISGSGGSGKTTLLRHLFLSVLSEKKRIPVFVELRRLNGENANSTIKELVFETLTDHGLKVKSDMLEQSFERGDFAIFLDGYDEIDPENRDRLCKEVRKLSESWHENLWIISSRPDLEMMEWHEFTHFTMMALDCESAVELVRLLPEDVDTKENFAKELEAGLFEKHQTFLSNPLLLSIMLLTYRQNASIPNRMSLFYGQAYNALFQQHDAVKGVYNRKRRTDLDIQDFERLFASFSMLTYDDAVLEFSYQAAREYLDDAKVLVDVDVSSNAFIQDAKQAVCLLVEDGTVLTYSHRSMQEYFVARFIQMASPTDQQLLIEACRSRISNDSTLRLLFEMNQPLVERQLILPVLRQALQDAEYESSSSLEDNHARFLRNFLISVQIGGDCIIGFDVGKSGIIQHQELSFISSVYGIEMSSFRQNNRLAAGLSERFCTEGDSCSVTIGEIIEDVELFEGLKKSIFWSCEWYGNLIRQFETVDKRARNVTKRLQDRLGKRTSREKS